MRTEDMPVLIVGGGGAGLSATLLLSKLGIKHALVSALPHTSQLPKAHGINQKTMEIFDEVGVAERILERSTPPENMQAVAWYAGVVGTHGDYGRRLGRVELFGAGYQDPDYVAASPFTAANLPQIRLEPLLKEHADKLGSDVRFGHEVIDVKQDDEGISTTVSVRETGERYTVRSNYLLACDGGRTIGKMVGIELEGKRELMRIVTSYISHDFSAVLQDEDVFIRWLVNPDFGGASFASGCLIPMGPTNWGTKSEEWVFHQQFPMEDQDAFDDAKVIDRMRQTIGIPDFDPKVHCISRWTMDSILADRFQAGRVFVLGDAAHRHPPTGGLGLNSAVQDAYNLCWKLGAVLNGKAGPALLETYGAERRPADAANVERSVMAAFNHFLIDEALGVSPNKTSEENWAALRPLWEDGPTSAEQRHKFNSALAQQTEFRHHNLEFGYAYQSAAVVEDGSPPLQQLDEVRIYQPSTKPGHTMPHAWVEREGKRYALNELMRGGRFVLIAGEKGQAWIDAANKLARELAIDLTAVRIGITEGDYLDVRCAWTKQREIGPDGAVLVRPDRYVGFRSVGAASDAEQVLAGALRQILALV